MPGRAGGAAPRTPRKKGAAAPSLTTPHQGALPPAFGLPRSICTPKMGKGQG